MIERLRQLRRKRACKKRGHMLHLESHRWHVEYPSTDGLGLLTIHAVFLCRRCGHKVEELRFDCLVPSMEAGIEWYERTFDENGQVRF
jgi:hypothetical protein